MSLSLLILFGSFVAQVYYNPFLPSGKLGKSENNSDDRSAFLPNSMTKYRFDYNTLEGAYLTCSIFLLISGLVFESSSSDTYESMKNFLSILVIVIILASSMIFIGIVVVELCRSIQYARLRKKNMGIEMLAASHHSSLHNSDNPLHT